MKRIAKQGVIGQLGVNLIERIVLQMRYIWRPTGLFDAGIDGEIEVCDPTTGEATNAIIKVQVKATTLPFHEETDSSLSYTCEQRDLDYWLRGNAPVVLVVCRPDDDEAYWVSIKDYFRELPVRQKRKIVFDKKADRFDPSCAHRLKLLALPKDSGIYFAPLLREDTLFTNLLRVDSFADKIYVADTDYRQRGEIWAYFKSIGARAGGEWTLKNKRIVSFQDLDTDPFRRVCDLGTLETFDAEEWAYSDDEDKQKEFVRLLNLSLKERTYRLGLRFHNQYEYYFFPRTRDLKTRKVWYPSIQRRASREVFRVYENKKDASLTAYCRHSAFSGYFKCLDDEWYMEITPTYHFTSDGVRDSLFREDLLKGIKRLERNPAVVGQLLMWVDFLRKPIKDLFSEEYPFLSFGDLATVTIEGSIPDDEWYYAEENSDEIEVMKSSDNQMDLFDT